MSLVGKKAPQFKVPAVVNNELGEFDSASMNGKWGVVFFYPLDFTFVCPTEIIAFSDAAEQFKKLDTVVVGVSVDSHFTHLAWINTARENGGLGKLNIPLAADLKKEISTNFGVLNEGLGAAYRGVFVIDPQGVVRSAIVNDLAVGRNVQEVVRTVKAFQFVTKNAGQVCPANWDEGKDSMSASPKGVADYLRKH
ncbi:MAG: peroxiredoxin [Planctomycetes bacterium]|nr:peroxiredoxin [Planctomycetota bacterium]